MKLKNAIEIYKKEEKAVSNAYDWYRKSAQKHENISIGDLQIRAFKIGREWHVDDNEFNKAIAKHRHSLSVIKENTKAFENGTLKGKTGETIKIESGSVSFSKDFMFESSDYHRLRGKSNGTWYCIRCNEPAKTEHNNPECHTCSDWGSCGDDCTLSRIYCLKCGTEKHF
jgi:rubrerythrin